MRVVLTDREAARLYALAGRNGVRVAVKAGMTTLESEVLTIAGSSNGECAHCWCTYQQNGKGALAVCCRCAETQPASQSGRWHWTKTCHHCGKKQ